MEKISELRVKFKNFAHKDETLEQKYDRKNNIFDYIRILFAIFVIVAHSYPIFFGIGASDVITSKLLKTESLGGIAVIGLLILSGFMITQSILHCKNMKEFIVKRIIRLFPALIVMLLLTVFVLGPVVYDGNTADYFKNPSVWKYLGQNINLFGNTAYSIDGVFTNNPYPSAINGSLWTLKHEFMLYIILMILSMCTVLKNKKTMLVLTAITIIIYVLNLPLTPIFNHMSYIGVVMEINQFVKLAMYFFIGSSIYLYKDKIKMSFPYFILAVIILLAGMSLNATKYVLILTMPYIIMYLGTFKFKKNILRKIGDISYGMYIYAFPIQQLLVFFFKDKLTIWTYMLSAIVITSILAIISTILIDNNTKKLKNKLFAK